MNDIKEKELFKLGLKLFNHKQFYDAHEYWEELWLEYHLIDKKFIQGLIQLTVGYYHWSTGNLKGAFSLLNKSLNKMEAFCPNNRGLDVGLIINSTKLSIQSIEDGKKIDWDKVPKLESSL
tara:strand:- start:915 stop:1277 length:363 start_codon:yes stop_codon:yes gene_type:complete